MYINTYVATYLYETNLMGFSFSHLCTVLNHPLTMHLHIYVHAKFDLHIYETLDGNKKPSLYVHICDQIWENQP